jgi:hypothetical protein
MKLEVLKDDKWVTVQCQNIKKDDRFRTVGETESESKEYLAQDDAFCDRSSGQWLVKIVRDNI